MQQSSRYVLGGSMVVLAVVGLFIAGRSETTAFTWTGWALFIYSIVFIFGMIARYVGTKRDTA